MSLYLVRDREPWDRRDREEHYFLFWTWVGAGCPPVEGEALQIAKEWDWQSRAKALRRRLEPQTPPSLTLERLDEAKKNALLYCVESVARWLRELRENPELVPSGQQIKAMRELASAFDTAGEYTRLLDANTYDLSSLSDEALEIVTMAREELEKSA